MKNQKGFTLAEVVFVLVFLIAAWGWTWNIIKVAGSDFSVLTGMLVLRVIGIFVAPLGVVMGFL